MPRENPKDGYSLATMRIINAALKEVRKTYGAATTKNVLEYARDPASPLHRFFDWDDSSAAEKYRLSQASQMIARVQVSVTQGDVRLPVRVYVNTEIGGVRQYVPTIEALSNEETAAQVLLEMKRDIESVTRRFKSYDFCQKSIGHLEAALGELDETIKKKTKRSETRNKKAA